MNKALLEENQKILGETGELKIRQTRNSVQQVWRRRELLDDDLEKAQQEFFETNVHLNPSTVVVKDSSDNTNESGVGISEKPPQLKNNDNLDSKAALKQHETNSVDELLEAGAPAAQLISDQPPPTIKTVKLVNAEKNSDRSLYRSGTYSLLRQKPIAAADKLFLDAANIESTSTNIHSNDIRSSSINALGSNAEKYSKATPSSRVNNLENSNKLLPKKVSLFAQRRQLEKNKAETTVINIGKSRALYKDSIKSTQATGKGTGTVPPEQELPSISDFLTGKIRENTVNYSEISDAMPVHSSGFPTVYVDEPKIISNNLESEHTEMDHSASGELKIINDVEANLFRPQKHDDTSYYTSLESKLEARTELYRQENDQKIATMSKEDILAAQEEIKSMISTDSINFLLNRPKKKATQSLDIKLSSGVLESATSTGFVKTKKATKTSAMKNIPSSSVKPVHSQPKLDESDTDFYQKLKQVYFENDVPETEKLEWITSFVQAKSPSERVLQKIKDQSTRAARVVRDIVTDGSSSLLDDPVAHVRFDFQGCIIDVLDETPTDQGLHHHGEDPDAAGYTIPEILHLMRSTVPSQRVVAVKLVGKILHNINTNKFEYKDAFAAYMCWLDWEGELYFPPMWIDSHLTVQVEAIRSSWNWVVEMSRYKMLITLKPSIPDPFVDPEEIVVKTYAALGKFLNLLLASQEKIVKLLNNDHFPGLVNRLVFDTIQTLYDFSDEFAAIIKSHKLFYQAFINLAEK